MTTYGKQKEILNTKKCGLAKKAEANKINVATIKDA
jgi:hypothetical protein